MGPKEYDLGLMLVEWSFLDGGQGFDMEMIKSILDGYNSAQENKYSLSGLKFWMYYSALCDAVTFLRRKAKSDVSVLDPSKSHMYIKARKALALKDELKLLKTI